MTAVAGAIYTAAQFNTYTRDNLNDLRASPPNRCEVYNTATQAVTAGNVNVLTFDTEVVDTAAMHSTSSNTGRITIPSGGGGDYLFSAVALAVNAAATASATFHLYKNGSIMRTLTFVPDAGGVFGSYTFTFTLRDTAAAGDYYEVAGGAVTATITFGSATPASASRFIAIGPLPPA